MTFQELGLSPQFIDRLTKRGILNPTPIQVEVFPYLLGRGSAVALSKTGTGKTLAYLAPLVEGHFRLTDSKHRGALILVPTRELAHQVSEQVTLLTDSPKESVIIVGGESEQNQIDGALKAPWWVATPGRILDLLQRRLLVLDEFDTLVLDEADRLLDMGFVDDMRKIVRFFPQQPRILFFSATLHLGVDEIAYELGGEFQRFGRESDELTVEGLDHRVTFIGDQEKFHALVNFLIKRPEERGIVFSNYRERAHEICHYLKRLGCRAESLTAQLAQSKRTQIMQAFRDRKVQVLIASDLAARGLDVFDLDFVVNWDLPEDPATYVHRVGRTARAGRKGQALSFVGFEDAFRLEKLESFLSKKIERFVLEPSELEGKLPRFGNSGEGPRSSGGSAPQGKRSARTAAPTQRMARQPVSAASVPSKQNTSVKATQSKGPKISWFSKLLLWLGFGSKKVTQGDESGRTTRNHSRRPQSGPGRRSGKSFRPRSRSRSRN